MNVSIIKWIDNMNECMNEWMHERQNECMNERMNVWRREWMHECNLYTLDKSPYKAPETHGHV